MESIEGEQNESFTTSTIDEAAVTINDESNDSTTAEVANAATTADADEGNAISDEVTSPESYQTTGAAEGKEETDDAAVNNSIDNKEAALTTNEMDTTASTTKTEQTAQENIETEAVPKSNDVNLLGFIDEGATNNFSTDTQAEMSSFPENGTFAETASNDFDLLGFGASETGEDKSVDDNCAVDQNLNELIDVGTEDKEKNDASEQRPDSDFTAEEALQTEEETNGLDPISNQSDTDEDPLLILSIANDIDKDTTVDINIPDVPSESGAVEDLLGVEPNEVSATIVTLPESADNGIDTEDSTQSKNEEDDGDASVATDTQPNEKDKTTPDSESVIQTQIETVEETASANIPSESCAVEDLLSVAPEEPSATLVTLPESTDNEIDAEESTQLKCEEVTNNDGVTSEDTDTQPNDESIPADLSGEDGSEQISMQEAMGLNSDNKVSDVKDVEDAKTNVQEMSPPADEPTATFAKLPEGNLNEEAAHLNVSTNNVGLTSEASDTQTNEFNNANMLDDVYQEEEEEGGDEVQNVEEEVSGINSTPVQNNEQEDPTVSAPAEAHTEEEAEWLSMGLTLGDALRQIVALTDERDSALAICQEKDDVASQAEYLLVEVQGRLEAEMNRRAESDSKARKLAESMNAYEERLRAYEKMEDELEAAQANLVTTVSEKSKLELEIAKLREVREESERKEAVLSNRLNEAKKKEANKSNTAGRLELDNEELRANLESTKAELELTSKAKAKLEGTMEKLKTKAVERVKQAETALKEERELNEQRKRKMKVFVETKAEELREAKESAGDMQKELQETRSSLTASREREESIQKDLESARIKYREVQRDMERMKRNAEALHSMGNNLEQELEKSANETEEHKKKRISAKHELMTMMRTLEVEKGVSEKLRESMKFTFAPKAQSQQQLLSECLRDLEQELDRLSIKLGKALLPQTQADDAGPTSPSKNGEGLERSESNGSGKKARRGRAAKADMDTERLISNLEQETQSVSKGIMALVSSIERMRILLDEDNTFNCMAFFSNHLGLAIGAGEARHQRLGDETTADDNEEAVSITSFEQR